MILMILLERKEKKIEDYERNSIYDCIKKNSCIWKD